MTRRYKDFIYAARKCRIAVILTAAAISALFYWLFQFVL